MKNDVAVSNPQWKNDGHGVLVNAKGDRIKRVGTTWRSFPKHAKVEAEKLIPVLSPEALPHLYIQE
jgi:hypothetical protein